jgi:hypothetical protein
VGGVSITLVLALMNEVSETIPGMILIKMIQFQIEISENS